jgi:hypothetical protein
MLMVVKGKGAFIPVGRNVNCCNCCGNHINIHQKLKIYLTYDLIITQAFI